MHALDDLEFAELIHQPGGVRSAQCIASVPVFGDVTYHISTLNSQGPVQAGPPEVRFLAALLQHSRLSDSRVINPLVLPVETIILRLNITSSFDQTTPFIPLSTLNSGVLTALSSAAASPVGSGYIKSHQRPPVEIYPPPRPLFDSTMSTIQNLKNFIRHGKQARNAHGDPTTNVSPVNAHQQRYQPPPPAQHQHAISDPAIRDHKPLQQAHIPGGDYSAANVDNRNVAAQAGGAAAKAAGDKQKMQERTKDLDPSVIERIVAEERESKGKLPKYPGLERWTLLEKMGDGAFSNVYRAKDSTGQSSGEVAIKVVRKFEMNSSQVGRASVMHFRGRISFPSLSTYFPLLPLPSSTPFDFANTCDRPTPTFTRTSKSNPRLWRCVFTFLISRGRTQVGVEVSPRLLRKHANP